MLYVALIGRPDGCSHHAQGLFRRRIAAIVIARAIPGAARWRAPPQSSVRLRRRRWTRPVSLRRGVRGLFGRDPNAGGQCGGAFQVFEDGSPAQEGSVHFCHHRQSAQAHAAIQGPSSSSFRRRRAGHRHGGRFCIACRIARVAVPNAGAANDELVNAARKAPG